MISIRQFVNFFFQICNYLLSIIWKTLESHPDLHDLSETSGPALGEELYSPPVGSLVYASVSITVLQQCSDV